MSCQPPAASMKEDAAAKTKQRSQADKSSNVLLPLIGRPLHDLHVARGRVGPASAIVADTRVGIIQVTHETANPEAMRCSPQAVQETV